MSGIGFSELIILFLIGLIVLGPQRLPRVANQLGSWLGQARRMTRVMRRQLEEEINLEQELSIKPKSSVQSPGYVKPAREKDPTWSPAHAADEPGTGVTGTDEAAGERGDQDNLDEDVDSALADPEPLPEEEEKAS